MTISKDMLKDNPAVWIEGYGVLLTDDFLREYTDFYNEIEEREADWHKHDRGNKKIEHYL